METISKHYSSDNREHYRIVLSVAGICTSINSVALDLHPHGSERTHLKEIIVCYLPIKHMVDGMREFWWDFTARFQPSNRIGFLRIVCVIVILCGGILFTRRFFTHFVLVVLSNTNNNWNANQCCTWTDTRIYSIGQFAADNWRYDSLIFRITTKRNFFSSSNNQQCKRNRFDIFWKSNNTT